MHSQQSAALLLCPTCVVVHPLAPLECQLGLAQHLAQPGVAAIQLRHLLIVPDSRLVVRQRRVRLLGGVGVGAELDEGAQELLAPPDLAILAPPAQRPPGATLVCSASV